MVSVVRGDLQVNEDEDDDDDDVCEEVSSTAATALQSLNHLITSAKDDVERRIRGAMTRTVDSLALCVRRKTATVTSPSCLRAPWHDVRPASAIHSQYSVLERCNPWPHVASRHNVHRPAVVKLLLLIYGFKFRSAFLY